MIASVSRIALVLILVSGCAKHAQPPPAVQDKLPEVTVAVDPPPKGDKIVIDGVHDIVPPPPETTPTPTLLAVAPDVTYAALVDTTLSKLQRTSYMLLVRTPKGIGAVPLLRPKAVAGSINDEPILIVTLARGSDGKLQVFVGGSAVSTTELEKALRDHNTRHLALAIDKTTTVGEMAEIIAIAHAAWAAIGQRRRPHARPVEQARGVDRLHRGEVAVRIADPAVREYEAQ